MPDKVFFVVATVSSSLRRQIVGPIAATLDAEIVQIDTPRDGKPPGFIDTGSVLRVTMESGRPVVASMALRTWPGVVSEAAKKLCEEYGYDLGVIDLDG